jgi:hypothetical protein
MLKTAARFLLLRFLPRRIVPIVTVVEALLFLRSIRKRSRAKVNPPSESRTAPPGPIATELATATASPTSSERATTTETPESTATERATGS